MKLGKLTTIAGAVLFAADAALVGVQQPAQATFPGESGLIAYTDRPEGEQDYEIYTVSPVGGEPSRVTFNSTHDEFPDFSPDGETIAYAGSNSQNDIYTIPTTSGTPTNLTQNDSLPAGTPVWSPEGDRIAYTRGARIFIMSSTGANPTQFAGRDVYANWQPEWSPDGSKLAYVTIDTEGRDDYRLFVKSSDGSGNNIEIGDPSLRSFDPSWSPDGTKLALRGSQ